MKIVVNHCYGGFGLSRKAFHKLRQLGVKEALEEIDIGELWKDGSGVRSEHLDSFCTDIARDNLELIKLIEENGSKWVSCKFAKLEIVEIPDGVEWEIEEYDGQEWISEKHRRW